MTCWRRLEEWNRAGVWQRLHEVLLAELHGRGQVGLVSGGHRFLPCSGREARLKSGPSPVDRARPGSIHHVLTEGAGIPLSVSWTGGHRNDVTELESVIETVPPVRGRRGRPRQRPDELK